MWLSQLLLTHLVLYCCMLYKCNRISGRSQNVEMVGGGRGGLPYMEVAPGTFLKIYYCLPPTSSAPLSVSSFDIHYEPFYLSLSSVHTCMFCFDTFLFSSAWTSCTVWSKETVDYRFLLTDPKISKSPMMFRELIQGGFGILMFQVRGVLPFDAFPI